VNETYRAIEVSIAGEFAEVRKPLVDPGPNQVRVRVEACGVCHTDSATVYDIVEADGFRFPSKQRAYVRGPELRAIRELLLDLN
jgi:NADPH:quinone reductase-like Zn-dependent oxidoreductase